MPKHSQSVNEFNSNYQSTKGGRPREDVQGSAWFLTLLTFFQIGVMGLEWYLNGKMFEPWPAGNPLLGPSAETLLGMGAKYGPAIRDPDDVYGFARFFMPIILHGGVVHLLLNMNVQWNLGRELERSFGSIRIIIIYILTGFSGNLLSAVFLPDVISVGASSSIFGLVGVKFGDTIQNWGVAKKPCRETLNITLTASIMLILGLIPQIDNFAHLGGFVIGAMATPVLVPLRKEGGILADGWKCTLGILAIPAIFVLLSTGLSVFYSAVDANGWCSFCWQINCIDAFFDCDAYRGLPTNSTVPA